VVLCMNHSTIYGATIIPPTSGVNLHDLTTSPEPIRGQQTRLGSAPRFDSALTGASDHGLAPCGLRHHLGSGTSCLCPGLEIPLTAREASEDEAGAELDPGLLIPNASQVDLGAQVEDAAARAAPSPPGAWRSAPPARALHRPALRDGNAAFAETPRACPGLGSRCGDWN
jgi:hypothetical protein